MEINIGYWFFVVDFIHFANRRKIIKHYIEGGTRKSHPHVQGLQHPQLSKPHPGLQILDTRMEFPRPSLNVVLDSIILEPWRSGNLKCIIFQLFLPVFHHIQQCIHIVRVT